MPQNLPDYVKPYKTKGVYVQKRANGYTLFRGHSERVPGKKYPKLVCDEYLGTVTEKDGFIPSRPSVKPGIRVLEYGLYKIVIDLTGYIAGDKEADKIIYLYALIGFIMQKIDRDRYKYTWASYVFKDVDILVTTSVEQDKEIERRKRQIRSILEKRFGRDTDEVIRLSRYVYAVYVNGGWHLSELPDGLDALLKKYSISLVVKEME